MIDERIERKVFELSTYLPHDNIFAISGRGYDIAIENGEVVMTNELDTALFIAIECHKRATADLIQDPIFRRGHFSNLIFDDGFQIGSLKWYYTEQAKITNETQESLQFTLQESLSFFVTDGLIQNFNVEVLRVPQFIDRLEINITLTLNDARTKQYQLFTKQ